MTSDQFIEEKVKEIFAHPAMEAANNAIVLQAVRYSTKGYEGPDFTDFLRTTLQTAITQGREEERQELRSKPIMISEAEVIWMAEGAKEATKKAMKIVYRAESLSDAYQKLQALTTSNE